MPDNFAAFQAMLPALLESPLYRARFVVVAGGELAGVHDTFAAALSNAVSRFDDGAFVVQRVFRPEDEINFVRAAL